MAAICHVCDRQGSHTSHHAVGYEIAMTIERLRQILSRIVPLVIAGEVLLLAPGLEPSRRLTTAYAAGGGETKEAPPNPPPDERFKADILVIVAHPDDETEVTGYLARAIFDEHKRVAAIFGTPGNGGGNAVSNAQAAALGDVRATEAREALAFFGVLHVWFLGGTDTPGQDVLRSLETWNHGNALWEAVRLVRLTRPEVILTWLPDYVAGEITMTTKRRALSPRKHSTWRVTLLYFRSKFPRRVIAIASAT
jgi:hypothetical protein